MWCYPGMWSGLVALGCSLSAAGCGGAATAKPRTTVNPTGPGHTEAYEADRAAEREAEQLAAVEFAMNQLDEGSQLCWAAAAAVDGFEISGALKFHIDIAAQRAATTVLADDIKNVRLRDCMVKLLSDYRWAPPLYGEGVELPFVFRAPVRQSVLDRRMVPSLTLGAAGTAPAVAVLLDAQNAGNPDASLLEVVIPARVGTGVRIAVRPELWYFLTSATITLPGQIMQVTVGDAVWLPANTVRNIGGSAEVRAVLLLVPGGVEGSARTGALATPLAPASLPVKSPPPLRRPTGASTAVASVAVPAKFAASSALVLNLPQGRATIIAAGRNLPASVTMLELAAGATIPAHQHAEATEIVYVLSGSALLTVDGVTMEITANSVLQFPKGIGHSATVTQAMRALVFYTPAGPERRFKTTVPTP